MSGDPRSPQTRAEDQQVLEYLAALEARRGAPSTFPQPERIVDDLASGDMMQPADDPEALRQQLRASAPGTEQNIEQLEDGFVAAAKDYATRHGIDYEGFIRAGVDPSVLQRAGIRQERE